MVDAVWNEISHILDLGLTADQATVASKVARPGALPKVGVAATNRAVATAARAKATAVRKVVKVVASSGRYLHVEPRRFVLLDDRL